MNKRILISAVLVALILLSTTASASSSTSASFGPAPATGTMSGGHYVLVDQTQRMSSALTGGRYQLAGLNQTTAAEGCCCKVFLPCTQR